MQGDELAHAIAVLTTQHYTLQGARAQVLSDSQARATIFLTSVSGALVALSLAASRGTFAFSVYGCVIFPVLAAMGTLTYVRGMQLEIEDALHARGIARIRQFYVEHVPAISPYLLHTTHDDVAGMVADMGLRPSRWQTLFTSPTMTGLVTVILTGAAAGFFAGAGRLMLPAALGVAFAAALLDAAVLWYIAQRIWIGVANAEVRSPSP